MITPLYTLDSALFDEASIRQTSGPPDASSDIEARGRAFSMFGCRGLCPRPVKELLQAFCTDENGGHYTDAVYNDIEGKFNPQEREAVEVLAGMLADGSMSAKEVHPFILGITWDVVNVVRLSEIKSILKKRGVNWSSLGSRIGVSLT